MDIYFAFMWWATFFVIGIVSFPITFYFFKHFFDIGYGFSKTTGLLIYSYLFFLLSSLKIIPFEKGFLILILIIYVILNLFIFTKNKEAILLAVAKHKSVIIFQELIFVTGFCFWVWVRGHQPEINGLEKFMDFGFVNSILRGSSIPPTDIWHSGSPINYYWFGHFYTAAVTKISGMPSYITYNLMMGTIPAFLLCGVFSITTTLCRSISDLSVKKIFLAGFISAVLVVFAGNFHTAVYAIKNGPEKYWYPDATRFIGYNPETNDKTIHEFPLYSFVVSDLHGHVLNLPFVVLYIAFLYSVVSGKVFTDYMGIQIKRMLIVLPYFKIIIPAGLILAIMFMTSTWDFGNYLILTAVAVFLNSYHLLGKVKSLLNIRIVALGLGIFLTSLIFASPFILNFESIAEGIGFVKYKTPLWQLSILWGYPLILVITYLWIMLRVPKTHRRTSDFFVGGLLLTSLILIAIPEIVYVKDIYAATHHRANTMFKLTYQAFVMSYLTSGYIFIRLLDILSAKLVKVFFAAFFAIIFGLLLWYPTFAINSYYGDLKKYKGLAGDRWMAERLPETHSLINWINNNIKGQPVILEAAGDSYTEYNLVSSYTGSPTVSGWFVHEWLWRGTPDIPQKRSTDVEIMYTSGDEKLVRSLILKYQVKYVVIGSFEKQRYPNINQGLLPKIGTVVFTAGDTNLYQIN